MIAHFFELTFFIFHSRSGKTLFDKKDTVFFFPQVLVAIPVQRHPAPSPNRFAPCPWCSLALLSPQINRPHFYTSRWPDPRGSRCPHLTSGWPSGSLRGFRSFAPWLRPAPDHWGMGMPREASPWILGTSSARDPLVQRCLGPRRVARDDASPSSNPSFPSYHCGHLPPHALSVADPLPLGTGPVAARSRPPPSRGCPHAFWRPLPMIPHEFNTLNAIQLISRSNVSRAFASFFPDL